jgi:hypothetical protein
MKWAVLACALTSWAAAQITPYALKVETGPGLVAITFAVQGNLVRAYFPDDVASGEPFSGTLDGRPNYSLEFAGQRARVRDGAFRWTMPNVQPGEFVPLILKDFRDRELGRASVQVAASRPPPAAFRFPKFVQAGHSFPVLGPFDGDSETSSFAIAGEPAQILAESPRKLVARAPAHVLGPVAYKLQKGDAEQKGNLRSIEIKTTGADAKLTVAVSGLNGLADTVPLKLDTDYIFIHPADIGPDGGFHAEVPRLSDFEAQLFFPQTPADEVSLILRVPRKDVRGDGGQEHAAALKSLGYDPLPVLESLLADNDLANDAAYAMLAVDEERGIQALLKSMPGSGPTIQHIGLLWYLSHFNPSKRSVAAAAAHATALRLLAIPGSSSEIVELALHTLGLSGSAEDLPLLEQRFQTRNAWTQRIQDASEAAMARLGSAAHLEHIRSELAKVVPAELKPEQAVRLTQILEKAGFAARTELLSAVCSHLEDPAAFEIDVTWDPKPSAVAALNAIVNQTTPIAVSRRKTLDEWKTYCRQAQ